MSNIPLRPKYTIKTYYSERKLGKTIKGLDFLAKHFQEIYLSFDRFGYFEEAFGKECTDGNVPGTSIKDLQASVYFLLGNQTLWPIHTTCYKYSEDNFFDIIEFLYEKISKPTAGNYHQHFDCGYHYTSFDKEKGQAEFREEINFLLGQYQNGFTLSNKGEIQQLASPQLQRLIGKNVPTSNKLDIEEKIRIAENKFLRHRSNLDDRRDAVKTLVDVLEFLRPQIKQVITKEDENDLFNIANNFGIRHHNQKQKTKYDQDIWLSWMFHFYLASIHAALHLIKRAGNTQT